MINTFWKIENFDLHSQMMRCVMHTTDLGVFEQILTGILQTYGQALGTFPIYNIVTVLILHCVYCDYCVVTAL